ncbi:carbohydrate kinase family protein [Cellulomonas olei]|uniref:carbohydrate kinase family protein n=1 Tax=Cellulomonas sp. P4 TaxID=3142533 RepID=UPI0031BA7E22
MTGVAVLGYASLDHAMQLAAFHGPDATSVVTGRLSDEWPRPGGIAHHVRALRAAGADEVLPVSWVGPDAGGDAWTAALVAAGAATAGVRVCGTRTPSSYLMYAGDGGAVCVFDPADCHGDAGALTPAQQDAVRSAGWCLLAVAPQQATRDALALLPDGARLVWAVKHDAQAYPPDLVEALLARADVVSLSAGERPFLDRPGRTLEERVRPGTLVVETRGAAGVHARLGGEADDVPVTPVTAVDTTGAGDTFVGTLVAGLLALPARLSLATARPALVAAAAAATDLIASRGARRTTPGPRTAPTEE